MNSKTMGLIGYGQFPRHLARGSHMGLHGATTPAFTKAAGSIYSTQRRHNKASVLPGSTIITLPLWLTETTVSRQARMVTLLGNLRDYMVPLNSTCPPHCAEPNVRTSTGRRCSIYSCIEFESGAHFSHSVLCSGVHSATPHPPRAPVQIGPGSTTAADSLPPPQPHDIAMPRLRPRMAARRGSSRGRSTSDNPSSSRLSSDSPPAYDYGSPSVSLTPNAPLRTTSPAPPSASNRIIRQTTQRADLRFDSASNRPTITAYITITLCEDAPLSPRAPPLSPRAPPPGEPRPSPAPSHNAAPPDPANFATPPSGAAFPSPSQVNSEAEQAADERNKQSDVEDPGAAYSCPIVEEQPSPSNSI